MSATCTVCNAQFQRVEHLNRHMLRHLGLRPFQCPNCRAQFSRRDSLKRHALNHPDASSNLDASADSPPRRRRYVFRACRDCRRSKQRCDGKFPCSRCTSKKQSCVYLPNERHQSTLVGDPSQHTVSGSESLSQEQPVEVNTDVEPPISNQPNIEPIDLSFDPTALLPDWTPEEWLTSGIVSQDKDDGLLQDTAFTNAPCPLNIGIGDVGAPDCSVENEVSQVALLIPDPCPTDTIPRADSPQFPELMESGVHVDGSTSRESEVFDELRIDCSSVLEPHLASRVAETDVWDVEDFGHVPQISTDIYNIIHTKFDDLNDNSSICQPFIKVKFPPLTALNAFIQSYFEYFHPSFPMLHLSSFDPGSNEASWLLVLAVATTGCRFSLASSPQVLFLLQELLRRSIICILHVDYDSCAVHNLALAQAAILSQIGMMFSSHQRFTDYAESTVSLIATICRKANMKAEFEAGYGGDTGSSEEGEAVRESWFAKGWGTWVTEESTRRMAYCCLLLDFQFSALFDLPAVIDIDSIHLPMPCSEKLWNTDTKELWRSEMGQEPGNITAKTLRESLQYLYDSKINPPGMGRFSALILTFGIYRDKMDSREKCNYLSIVRPDEAHMQSNEPLDQLIFQHNHVLSLFTRLPARQLFAFSGWRATVAQQRNAENCIRDWLSKDIAGSRLCLVHAAKVYSSIRSNRTYGHHEVMGILLSTLAIWSISSIDGGKGTSISTEFLPTYPAALTLGPAKGLVGKRTIRLDKTLDGSLLAGWISGQVPSRPYLAGVGTLGDHGTARRLIPDSVQLLISSTAWCLGQRVAEILKAYYRNRTGDLSVT